MARHERAREQQQRQDGLWAVREDLLGVLAAARAGDWGTVRAHLIGAPEVDDALFVLGLAAEVDELESALEDAHADGRVDDPWVGAMLGSRRTVVAWRHRTHARARDVSREQFEHFRVGLVRAEQVLIKTCAEHPDFVPAWHARLATARGLELGASESRRRYDRLAAYAPHAYRPQLGHLVQLAPRWGGSAEATLSFARDRGRAAPPGAAAAALPARAHVEIALDHGTSIEEHLGTPEVRAEVLAASRQVLLPDGSPDLARLQAHADLAFALSFGGLHDEAAPHFAALPIVWPESPWGYVDRPHEVFVEMRRRALETVEVAR
ncbi:hypothetical protein CLV28_1664 [Sediminihabitans luteus]|uniref:Uncharacterized protein n=1 Tax=Sediminihabitans luteus TaxID=1138585 RepID=A0A2M9CQF6_9CELL|nr:hypothetical protein [Sediminihabitans luteus]PJJ74170.1 hypothetical protein CLV28_1664 [Sediminihabitans luteus]GII99023.1 hypothetical protein Slu03_14010 [Sediminihabitans luteus]